MTRNAVLLMDLQRDFLGEEGARMPVQPSGAAAVIRTTNAILRQAMLGGALPVLVVNRFLPTDRIGNFFRKGAAIDGTPGAEIDPRIAAHEDVKTFAKARPSAFTNPELDEFLAARGITDLYVIGVFAEGCVRSTALDAKRRGYAVHVLADAVASDAAWKKRLALWVMARAGVEVIGGEEGSPAAEHMRDASGQ